MENERLMTGADGIWNLKLGVAYFAIMLFWGAAFPLAAGPEDSPFYRLRPVEHGADGHRGRITALALAAAEQDEMETPGENAVVVGGSSYLLSAGEDGFLVLWDRESLRSVERYQLSNLPIMLFKAHPERSEIAFVESDGLNTNRLRVINYWTKGELFTRDFAGAVACIDYSPSGNLLFAALESGVVEVLDARLGAEVRPAIRETAAYLAVSPTERTVAVYSPSGRLSYWNIETGVQTAALSTAAFLTEPVMFRNYNLLAGRLNGEFVLVNAVNGRTVLRGGAVTPGMLFRSADDGGIACAAEDGVRVYTIGDSGALETAGAFLFPAEETGDFKVSAAIADAGAGDEGFFLGFADGRIMRISSSGGVTAPSSRGNVRRKVTEAVADNEKLLFMTEDGGEGESPLDYRTILAGNGVTIPAKTAPLNTTEGRRFPITGAPAGSLSRARFPVAALNGKLLYLSGDGPVIRQADNEGAPVSIFLPLVIDACFVDDRTIITVSARAAGGSLLQLVNIATGETVPLEMPGLITLKVQRGTSGDVYAAVTGMSGGPVRILRLDLEYPSRSRRILERGDGGDDFSFAESGNALVTNLGSRTADFYARDRGYALFHGSRLPAFPVRILDAGRDVIIIDDEGSIIWLNAQNGQLEAVLRLYDGEWELRAANGEHAQGR